MQGRRNDINHTHPPIIFKQLDSPMRQRIKDCDSSIAIQSSFDCEISASSQDGILSDPGLRFSKSTESVHYHQSYGCYRSSGASCHGRFEQNCIPRQPPPPNNYVSAGIPPWVHVFNNSTTTSSLRTQSASISHLETTTSLKSQHRRNRRAKKKFRKQQRLLREVIVPNHKIHTFTSHEIEQHIIVVDGGNPSNPPIRAPAGVSIILFISLFIQSLTAPI